ncbi:WhiB family transcriptional regulator [Streptomyces sp. NPDC058629]|uniref:WhiB family transcriptional regulator n=1 Tax=Streptomyces sp. NPDC058629 TaxID=3346565 RepID=UPI00364C3496
MNSRNWRGSEACRTEDPELFFPKGTDAASMDGADAAVRICRRCPAMEACAEWAIDTRQDHGVWGGLTEQDRAALRRHGRIPQKRTPIQAFASIQDAYGALAQKDGRHVIWTGGNEVRIGSVRMTPNQVAWRARRRTPPVGRVFTDCDRDGCVRHLNDQAMRQARDAARTTTAERSAAQRRTA